MPYLILVAGMPGSGKSLVSDVASSLGLNVYVMGDVVREEARRRGLPLTDEVLGRIAVELRKKEGMDVIARRLYEKLVERGEKVAFIEGLRSLEEYDFFRKNAEKSHLIAVHASPETRYCRLKSRGREDDPKTREEFDERDRRELGMGIGSVIALAQTMLVNENIEKTEFSRRVEEVLQEILRRWDLL